MKANKKSHSQDRSDATRPGGGNTSYVSPLVERYSSEEMSGIFSPDAKYRLWRALWISLARAQKQLGLAITQEQIADLEKHRDTIDYARLAHWEQRTRHDVMAHIRHYAELAKVGGPILHLGATSMFVVDNADLIVMRRATDRILALLVNVIDRLREVCWKYRSVPAVGYTHFQPAQLTTLGKRLSLWLSDLVEDVGELETARGRILFLGSQGAVGTQAGTMELFEGDERKAKKLDLLVAKDFGFSRTFGVTGQTYSRKLDARILGALSSVAQSAHKAGNDLRLMQHLGEAAEPFQAEQVGSSAMPYKQNPVLAERMCSLARLITALSVNQAQTAAVQWLERTLDDSAGKRIALPEAFLAADGMLHLYLELVRGLQVRSGVIRSNVEKHFPFIATENIMMRAVRMGGDRQKLHELVRVRALEARQAALDGKENDLLSRLKDVPELKRAIERSPGLARIESYIGRAPSQVAEFLRRDVDGLVRRYRKCLGIVPQVRF